MGRSLSEDSATQYVGFRKLDRVPFVVHLRSVSFLLDTEEAAYSQLVSPLTSAGWKTLDTT